MLIQEEIWKDVKGLEGYYQVSNKGRVKSVPRTIIKKNGYHSNISEKILKPSYSNKGTTLVSVFSKDGKIRVKPYKALLQEHFGANYEIVDIALTQEVQEGELFKDVRGYEELYEVSNYGTVRSKERVVTRKDGRVRRVVSKILSRRECEGACLSRVVNGVKTADTYSICHIVMAAFYKDYDPRVHYIRKIHEEGDMLQQYQYFVKFELNPLNMYLPQGNCLRFRNYVKAAEYFNSIGLKSSTDPQVFKAFFFQELHSIMFKNFDGMQIIFDHPVQWGEEVKLIKVFTTSVTKNRRPPAKRKYKKKV